MRRREGKLGQREDASFADAPLTYTLALANPTQPIPTPASLQSHLQKSVGLQCFFFLKVLIRAVVEAAEIQMGALYGETTQLTLLSSSFK